MDRQNKQTTISGTQPIKTLASGQIREIHLVCIFVCIFRINGLDIFL